MEIEFNIYDISYTEALLKEFKYLIENDSNKNKPAFNKKYKWVKENDRPKAQKYNVKIILEEI